ncbi:hypothetical protein BJ322DRAFT_1210039 [Thelephora terrestris]|uniref:Uncharacterized protein n=1 Tax=Thelephora terrestris TaxID=56493 RepID=A0A9P6L7U5_9AGAM|nr:hypothetical protein BJ322DRAFT_1210039 [Thelephora terrestris]
MEHELRLRSHIRALLLDYCHAHITEDYVTFTQDAVQTTLSDRIALVPLEDPNSVVLPVDPMDALLRSVDAPLIPEEKWATDTDSLGHIRKTMNLGATSLETSKSWHESDPYERVIEAFRPTSPILSRRGFRQTPKFGGSGTAASPDSLRSTLDAYTMVLAKVPDMPTPPLPNLEEILDIQYKLEPKIHRETMALIRSVHTGTKLVPDQTNSAVETFLRSDSPPLSVVEAVEVPIFPRSSWPGFADGSFTSSTKIPRSMSDLRCLAPTVEIEEEDLRMEHMSVVDGWTVYPPISSPSPTPSLGLGGTSSQVDEMFPPSPPAKLGVGLSILELDSLKMVEAEIPRQSRVGHGDDGLSRLPQSLASLLPRHQISLVDVGAHQEEYRPPECTDDITIASSMLGQPPSKFDADDERETYTDDLRSDLRVIWSKAGCDEFAIILQDGIDESKALLFEVPELPPPTAHEPWVQLPRNMISLTSSFGMVKGVRSLNLELSWIPFKYGSKVPADEEVSRASGNVLDDLTILTGQDSRQVDEVRRLLSDLDSSILLEPVSDLAFAERTHQEDFMVAKILSNDGIRPHQLALTRDERYMISRMGANRPGQLAPDSLRHSVGSASAGAPPIFDAGGPLIRQLEFSWQSPQRDYAEIDYLEPEYYDGEDEDEPPLAPVAKKRRLGYSSPVVYPCSESPLRSPDRNNTWHDITLPMTVSTSPMRAQPPNGGRSPRPPLALDSQVLQNTPSRPRDLGLPNLSGTVHQSVPSAAGQVIEPSPALVTRRGRDFDEFLALRGVHSNEPLAAMTTEIVVETTDTLPAPRPATTEVPPDLIDKNTIQVPAVSSSPASRHQYLASLDLIQKYALCRCLSDDAAAIDLIEREFLGGVDLILDQDSAILFLPLSALPSECEGLIAGISDISWRYSHMLVIFEAFLTSQAFGDGEENRFVSFAFTETILKSVKKLRRSLLIAEGVGTKTEDCLISWAFATNIEEAARLARVYGDIAESRDTGGMLWQERWWLGEREAEDSPLSEFEDERDLAMVAGMNAFAACLILSQMSSDQFLSLGPQERMERFSRLLGEKRMAGLNLALEQSAADLPSSLPASDLGDSSSIQL